MISPQIVLVAAAALGLVLGAREAGKGLKKTGQAIAHVFHHHSNKDKHATETPRGNQPPE